MYMSKLLSNEYFHLGTDEIYKELWENIQTNQISNLFTKPCGGLWTSPINPYTLCDWIGYKIDETSQDELEIIKYLKSSLVKFKEDCKFISIENSNDYKKQISKSW